MKSISKFTWINEICNARTNKEFRMNNVRKACKLIFIYASQRKNTVKSSQSIINNAIANKSRQYI